MKGDGADYCVRLDKKRPSFPEVISIEFDLAFKFLYV